MVSNWPVMIKTPVCAALCKRSEILTGDFAAHSHPLEGPLLAPQAIHRISPEAFAGVKEDSTQGGGKSSSRAYPSYFCVRRMKLQC